MSAKTDELNSISDMKTNSVDPSTSASSRINTQRTRNSNGDDIASLEAKISSIQMTLKSLEKVMHQQTGQI
jgi:TolA-binding protein